MTTLQIIGLIVVALLGLYVFYCIYDLDKYNNKKDRRNKHRILTMALLIFAMTIGKGAWAQDFSIEATYNSSTHKTLFTIERSGSSLPQQTIKYRTVNLSAYAGIHYTAVSDTYTFPENITTFQVEVSESAQYTTAYAYHYQTGTTRSYRFEVLDVNGFELAHNDRSMTTGAQFSNTYLNNGVTDLVYFNDNGQIQSGSGNKYLDVSYSSSNWTQVTDAGYSQGVHTVSTNSLYNSNSNLRTILNALSYKMYATVYFTQKEEHDGYQYIQIYTGNAGTYDNVNDPNGDIGTLTNSIYRACFILSKSASVMSNEHYQFFPHRYDYVNKAAETTAGITHYEFDYDDSYLYKQKYLSSSYKSSTSGSLVLLPTAENINIRFDAGGGGLHDNDEWDFKNLKVRLALVDETYPTPINIAGITVSAGPYVKGNTFYISVPFSEIVNTAYYSNNKKLVTSWGDATYCSGDGTNVITFKGTINANAGTTLAITSLQCNFKDLTGTLYQGLGSSNYTDSFDKTFTGVTCTESYTLEAANTEFTGLADEYVLSNNGPIQPHPTVYFYKGKKESANKVQLTENTNYTLSWANNNTAGNGRVTATGTGIYTGSASTTFPIRWSTYTVSFHENGSTAIPATGTMSDQAFQYGVAQNLTANAFSREGFTFAGWNTQPDGNGTAYSNEQSLLRLTPTDGAVIDLYAQWALIPWTGSGDNANDPYIILYASQLDLLATNVNSGNNYSGKFFKLDADITYAHTTLWNDANSTENNYTAIGTSTNNFRGTFDGDNHTISGIRIYNTDDNQGLFGYANYATIKNVILSDARIEGNTYIGGIAGYIHYATTIQSCLVSNAAITGNNKVGAVVGFKYSSTDHLIYNYYLGCIVKNGSTTYYTGIGLGQPQGDYVNEVASLHTLSLSDNITASGENVVIDNVTYYAHKSTITLGYTGTMNAGYSLGYAYNDGQPHIVDGNTFEMPGVDNVAVSSTFTDVWGIAGGADGTEAHPYIISDTTGLNVLAKCVNGTDGYTTNNFYNKHFKLGNDITYSTEGLGENESNYTAIGNYDNKFKGSFDGVNHTISGIRIYTTNDYQGLFGYVYSGSTVKNIALANSIIIGGDYVGSIAGKNEYGTITNCRIGNDVTIGVENDDKDYHGGIVGYQYDGTVSGSVIAASVNGLWYCGGIAGICVFTTLKDCLYTGTIANDSWKGAITGKNNNSTLTNNYYTTDGIGGVNGSDCNGARRARVITLGDNVGIAGDQTVYDVSGITAMGATVLSYNDGNSTTVYSGATQDVTLSDAAPQGYAVTSYSLNGTPLEGNAFTMPDSDVTVSATIGVPYIDADGNEQVCTDYTLVESSTGNTVILGAVGTETWYAVSGNVNITVSDDKAIKTYGAVHLILMDGATLTVGGQYPIFASGSPSIYGQSLGTGSLTASGSGSAIYVYDGTLTINGGIVTATSSNGSGIYAYDITINGGSVSADGGGINANGALTLGWHNASDRIYASSYYGYSGVAVKSGQYLSDGTAGYSGTLSTTQVNALAGKTLQPAFALTLPKYVNATSGALVQEGHTAYAQAGANVTIAGEGCTLADVTVGGEAATDNGDGTWSFIMPATDATVSATVPLPEVTVTNNVQTICMDNQIQEMEIIYSNGTIESVTGLPENVNWSDTPSGATIFGAPAEYGTFNATVTVTSDQGCGTATADVTITVKPNPEVTVSNNFQTVCENSAITAMEITATHATIENVTGLPTGVSWSKDSSGATGTISGTPTASGTYNVTVTVNSDQTPSCGIAYAYVRITVNPLPEAYTFLDITGYGDSDGGWNLIASPLAESIAATEVDNLVAETASDFDLYRFNQAANMEWENWKQEESEHYHFNLESGQGYLYASKEDVTLTFLGTPNSDDAVNVSLSYTEGKPLAGFNLVGNPFTVDAYVNRPFYKMNDAGTGIEAIENYNDYTTAQTIPACTGIVVKADNSGESVIFSTTAPSLSAPNNGNLQITLTQANTRGNALLDNAIVSFNEGSQLGKFYFGEQNGNIYIPQGGKEFAIAYSEGMGEMPLNFKARKNGEYTITVNPDNVEMSFLHLIDNLTGADVDLLQTPSYTFSARNDDYASRFKLVFKALGNSSETEEDFAFISNGEIIINGKGIVQVIDLMGRIILADEANRNISTKGFVSGVYVLRLIDGENAKTQKIVIQ